MSSVPALCQAVRIVIDVHILWLTFTITLKAIVSFLHMETLRHTFKKLTQITQLRWRQAPDSKLLTLNPVVYVLCHWLSMGFPGGSALKNLPAGDGGFDPWRDLQEGTLEKEMATHSSILAGEILWTKVPGRLQSMGSKKRQTQISD